MAAWGLALAFACPLSAIAKNEIPRAPVPVLIPIDYADKTGYDALSGVAADVFSNLSRRAGVSLRPELAPRDEVLQRTMDGSADVIAVSARLDDRGLYKVTAPFINIEVRLYSTPWQGLLKNNTPLAKRRLAALANSPVTGWLLSQHPGVHVIEVANLPEGLRAVREGRADGFLAHGWVVRRLVQQLGGLADIVESDVQFSYGVGLSVNQRHPALYKALDQALVEMTHKGEIDALWQRHAAPALPTLTEYWLPRAAAALTLIILIGVGTSLVLARRAQRRVARLHAMEGALLTDTPWMTAEVDEDSGRVLRVNPAFAQALGVADEAFAAMDATDLGLWNATDDGPPIREALQASGRSMHRRVVLRSPTGKQVLFEGHFARIASAGTTCVLVHGTDATAREMVAREREVIIERAPVGIMLTEGLRVVLMNPAAEALYGCTADHAMLEEQPHRVWPSTEAFKAFQSDLRAAFSEGRVIAGNYEMQTFDGRPLSVRMTGQLIDATFTPRARSLWLIEDRSAEAAAQQLLQQARDSAESASAAKSAFVARMSHEIRTPLHGLVNLHSMMARTRLNKTQTEFLDRMSVAQQALMALVNEVLDFSKIESGGLVLEQQPFFIASLLEEVNTVLRSQLRKQGVTLTLSHAGTHERLLKGDANRLRQVLINLGNNAIKFTEKGAIRIRVQCDADPAQPGQVRMYFSVSDTGIGMSADVQQRIFRPFAQAHEGIQRRFGGTGLGLAICAEIVRSMGGELTVESTEGQGSVFSFSVSLPQGQPSELPDALKPAHVPGTLLAAERHQPLHGLRLLVVDDNELNRFVTGQMLEALGAEVSTVADGSAALLWLEHSGTDLPHFVLMDVQMPGMDGVTATTLIRERHEWRDVIVVALTGDVTVEQRDAIVAAGAAAFIAKPVGSERLAAMLRGLMPYPLGRLSPPQRAGATLPRERSAPAPMAAPAPTLPLLDGRVLEIGLRELQHARDGWQRVGRSDARALAALAHRTKGTATDLGLRFLWDASAALEKACKAQAHDPAGWPLATFESALREADAWLAQQLAQTTTPAK